MDLNTLKLEQVFSDISDAVMGPSGKRKMDVVVQIDPANYDRYPNQLKYGVAKAIETINDYYRGNGKNCC